MFIFFSIFIWLFGLFTYMTKIELELEDDVKNTLDDELGKIGITLSDFLANVVSRQDKIPMFGRPQEYSDKVRVATTKSRLAWWIKNLRKNIVIIDASPDITSLPKVDGPVLCLAAGESLNLHLDEIKEFKGTIISTERNLIKLLECEIVPKYVISVECDTGMLKFMGGDRGSYLIDKYADQMTGVFTTVVSPEFIEWWKSDMCFYNAWVDPLEEYKSISSIFMAFTGKSLMHCAGNAGSTLWYFAQSCLEAKEIVLLGIDFAYTMETPWSDSLIWPDIKNLSKEKQEEHFFSYTNKFDRSIYTEQMWLAFRDVLFSWIDGTSVNDETETIQCSDYTILDAPPLKTMLFRDYLDSKK